MGRDGCGNCLLPGSACRVSSSGAVIMKIKKSLNLLQPIPENIKNMEVDNQI